MYTALDLCGCQTWCDKWFLNSFKFLHISRRRAIHITHTVHDTAIADEIGNNKGIAIYTCIQLNKIGWWCILK